MSQLQLFGQQLSIMQLIDWRFVQMQHELQAHSTCIKNMIDGKFQSLDGKTSRILKDVSELKEYAEENREDIEDLKEDRKTIMDRLDRLENHLERIEQNTKACNLLFINVQEHRREDNHMTMQIVLDTLNAYDSSDSWRHEDLVNAFRLGRPRPHGGDPRPILVQFCRWSDKMAVLGDSHLRDCLRQEGIKVASDLTTRQKEMVDFHRSQGKIAYIYNGKLQVRERQETRSQFHGDGHSRDNFAANGLGSKEWPHMQHDRDSKDGRHRFNRQYAENSSTNKPNRQSAQLFRHQDGRSETPPSFTRKQRQTTGSSYLKYGDAETTSGSRFRHLSYYGSRVADQSQAQHSALNQGSNLIPVVPGTQSYSEATRGRERQVPETRRTVSVKGPGSRAAVGTSVSSRHRTDTRNNNSQQNMTAAQGRDFHPVQANNAAHHADCDSENGTEQTGHSGDNNYEQTGHDDNKSDKTARHGDDKNNEQLGHIDGSTNKQTSRVDDTDENQTVGTDGNDDSVQFSDEKEETNSNAEGRHGKTHDETMLTADDSHHFGQESAHSNQGLTSEDVTQQTADDDSGTQTHTVEHGDTAMGSAWYGDTYNVKSANKESTEENLVQAQTNACHGRHTPEATVLVEYAQDKENTEAFIAPPPKPVKQGRPSRRAASLKHADTHSKHAMARRTSSQSSILDSLRRVSSGDRPKGNERSDKLKTNSKYVPVANR
eukprot:TRINITY_DN1345_c0_g1_i6.p1 TRINITY_DN1345_c0_g1~~TRINITY_DN1345_c0_g1_i6.p1  ORF type:complete len:715 (-),score=155.21 TRINITY_DN1345_c0_g1_i6:440-2584(-)